MTMTFSSSKWIRIVTFGVILITSCEENDQVASSRSSIFDTPVQVEVSGYTDHIMEPFLSRDGTILFFNNLNDPSVNTNMHWAKRVNDLEFAYQGEIENANTESLEGVPTMDAQNLFYFVSTRSYDQTLSTIYLGLFANGRLSNVSLVENISRNQPGWVNFDVEISDDGNRMYFVDGLFDENGGPYEANFIIAEKTGSDFDRVTNSSEIFKNINTQDLEYAAAITKDELELCFTRVAVPFTNDSEPRLYLSKRSSRTEAFSVPVLLENITGFVEGATYTPDDMGIYFHKKEANLHRLYLSKRVIE